MHCLIILLSLNSDLALTRLTSRSFAFLSRGSKTEHMSFWLSKLLKATSIATLHSQCLCISLPCFLNHISFSNSHLSPLFYSFKDSDYIGPTLISQNDHLPPISRSSNINHLVKSPFCHARLIHSRVSWIRIWTF